MHRRAVLSALPGLLSLPGCGRTHEPEGPARTRGLDPALLAQSLVAATALPKLHALIIARDGAPLVERVFRGPDLDRPVNVKSASKSVLAAIAGVAIGRGLAPGVGTGIRAYLGDRFPGDPDPRLDRITVSHLLSMQAGLASTSGANYGAWVSSANWIRYALARPFDADPGGTLIYSTGTSHLLSALLTRATGRSTLQLARDTLGDALDLEIPSWPADPQGVYVGGNDMRLSPRGLLKLGELYRNDGVHEGRRVLPEGWVDTSWTPRGRSRWTGHAYGYGWWQRASGARRLNYAWGYGGQMVFVAPALNLTAVMISDPTPVSVRDNHVQALHQLMDVGIIPAAERGASV